MAGPDARMPAGRSSAATPATALLGPGALDGQPVGPSDGMPAEVLTEKGMGRRERQDGMGCTGLGGVQN